MTSPERAFVHAHLDELHADYIQAIFESNQASHLDLQAAVQLALVGRYYERIADHAASMGRRIIYVVTGQFPEEDFWPQP